MPRLSDMIKDNEEVYFETPVDIDQPGAERAEIEPEKYNDRPEVLVNQIPLSSYRLSGRLPMAGENEGDYVFEIHNYLTRLRGDTSKFDLETARIVFEIKSKKLYKLLGADTFETYLAQPEINMSRASAFQMAAVYGKYVVELGLDPADLLGAGIPKLATMKKYVTPENAMELISFSEGVSRSDLREELAERFDDPKVKKPNKNFEPLADDLFRAVKNGNPQEIEIAMDNYAAAKQEVYGEEWKG